MPINNIIIGVTIFANHKNNYYIVPCISDNKGMIEFSKGLIEKEIDFQRNLYIMDYASTLEDCKPEIKIEILNYKSINNLLAVMNLYPEAYYNNNICSIQNSNNLKYESKSQIINFESEKEIYYNLKIKKIIIN